MRKLFCAAAMTLCLTNQALAAINLQITEIWAGQSGADVTTDWFEITNLGDMPWVDGVDGELRVDDSSRTLGTSWPVSQIVNILPGESVIVLMEGEYADKLEFLNVWKPVKPEVKYQNIGITPDAGGLGLGQGGGNPQDGVTLYLGGVEVDFETYVGSGLFTDGQSYDVTLGAYSLPGNPSGAVATNAFGGEELDVPAVGSPGSVFGSTAAVPEPSSLALLGLAVMGLAARRR